MRTQVAIIGAGPAGLLLAQLLHQRGIDSVVLEAKSREYVENRVRAGVLEHQSVDILQGRRRGGPHDAGGAAPSWHSSELRRPTATVSTLQDLTGRAVMIYGQQEVVKDLIAARLAARQPLYFEVDSVSVHDFDTDSPRVRFRSGAAEQTLECDFIAGCDGFHGICRATAPADQLSVYERVYPFAWLGILAEMRTGV